MLTDFHGDEAKTINDCPGFQPKTTPALTYATQYMSTTQITKVGFVGFKNDIVSN